MRYIIAILFAFSVTQVFADTVASQTKQCTYNGIEYQQASKLATELQNNLKKKDQKDISAITAMIGYPFHVNAEMVAGKPQTKIISDAKTLQQQFSKVFTPKVINAILAADPKDIFCNYQGAMIGKGVVWFQKNDKKTLKLTVVNL